MLKKVFTNLKTYEYYDARKGAKYTFDGVHFMNNGEFSEAQYKHCLGFKAEKDFNTPFDVGSDIKELTQSVKSSKASLTSVILGYDLQTSLNSYFERVASTSWAWVIIIDGTLTAYEMNEIEFREFCETWASFQRDRQNVRFKATSGKMIQWFESRL